MNDIAGMVFKDLFQIVFTYRILLLKNCAGHRK
jgi:hypothetical protein